MLLVIWFVVSFGFGILFAEELYDERIGHLPASFWWAHQGAMMVLVLIIAGYFGIDPPGFVAQVVAFAFGLAAASFFPVILLGLFDRRTNREGAVSGMIGVSRVTPEPPAEIQEIVENVRVPGGAAAGSDH